MLHQQRTGNIFSPTKNDCNRRVGAAALTLRIGKREKGLSVRVGQSFFVRTVVGHHKDEEQTLICQERLWLAVFRSRWLARHSECHHGPQAGCNGRDGFIWWGDGKHFLRIANAVLQCFKATKQTYTKLLTSHHYCCEISTFLEGTSAGPCNCAEESSSKHRHVWSCKQDALLWTEQTSPTQNILNLRANQTC